jgi:hypothetical protein
MQMAEAASCSCNGSHDHTDGGTAPRILTAVPVVHSIHFTRRGYVPAGGLGVGPRTSPGMQGGPIRPAGQVNAPSQQRPFGGRVSPAGQASTPDTTTAVTNTIQQTAQQGFALGQQALQNEAQKQHDAAQVAIAQINANAATEQARIAAQSGQAPATTYTAPADTSKEYSATGTGVTSSSASAPATTGGMAWYYWVLLGLGALVLIGGIWYVVTKDGRRHEVPPSQYGRARQLAARNPEGYGPAVHNPRGYGKRGSPYSARAGRGRAYGRSS